MDEYRHSQLISIPKPLLPFYPKSKSENEFFFLLNGFMLFIEAPYLMNILV